MNHICEPCKPYREVVKKTSYTKGDWEVFRFSTYHNWKVKTGDDNWFIDCGVDENSEANAHLIAAAPDMYEALKAIDKWFYDSQIVSRSNVAPVMYKLVENVIAKVKGK